jgi:hypothetical protein
LRSGNRTGSTCPGKPWSIKGEEKMPKDSQKKVCMTISAFVADERGDFVECIDVEEEPCFLFPSVDAAADWLRSLEVKRGGLEDYIQALRRRYKKVLLRVNQRV